jgi:hypothetical protein
MKADLDKISGLQIQPIGAGIFKITNKTVFIFCEQIIRFFTRSVDGGVTMWGIDYNDLKTWSADRIIKEAHDYEGLHVQNPIEDTFNISEEFKLTKIYQACCFVKGV